MKWSHWNHKPVLFIHLGFFLPSHNLLPNCKVPKSGGWLVGSGWGAQKPTDSSSTVATYINHSANKLKAKWLLALSIYHEGKPNEVLYTLEDRGMLLFITMICGWLLWLWTSWIRDKFFWLRLQTYRSYFIRSATWICAKNNNNNKKINIKFTFCIVKCYETEDTIKTYYTCLELPKSFLFLMRHPSWSKFNFLSSSFSNSEKKGVADIRQ